VLFRISGDFPGGCPLRLSAYFSGPLLPRKQMREATKIEPEPKMSSMSEH
jgi:hypothetical protein